MFHASYLNLHTWGKPLKELEGGLRFQILQKKIKKEKKNKKRK